MEGTALRLRRLFPSADRRLFSVPLDHSLSMGPIDGLEALPALVGELGRGGVDLVIVPPGAVRAIAPVLPPTMRLGVHVSASTSLGASDHKVLAGTAVGAVALGADLLSVQVNFGVPEEPEMLRSLGHAAEECRALGLPLLAMAYVKGERRATPEALRHAARAAADLGADIVKTAYPGSADELRRLVRSTPVPVLLGGGPRLEEDEAFLRLVRETVDAGAGGICIGRNLFQRRPVEPIARTIAGILHGAPG
jgi:DhnA family fructose-bisphosphate aldolase class Ia